jgi:hypothetical protein
MVRTKIRSESQRKSLTLAVEAAAVSVRRIADFTSCSAESTATNIRIEGRSDGPDCKTPRETLLLVSPEVHQGEVTGFALGGNAPWTVGCELPRDPFTDLLAIVLANKLATVEMVFDSLRWHKGNLLSIQFCTRPLPTDIDASGSEVWERRNAEADLREWTSAVGRTHSEW